MGRILIALHHASAWVVAPPAVVLRPGEPDEALYSWRIAYWCAEELEPLTVTLGGHVANTYGEVTLADIRALIPAEFDDWVTRVHDRQIALADGFGRDPGVAPVEEQVRHAARRFPNLKGDDGFLDDASALERKALTMPDTVAELLERASSTGNRSTQVVRKPKDASEGPASEEPVSASMSLSGSADYLRHRDFVEHSQSPVAALAVDLADGWQVPRHLMGITLGALTLTSGAMVATWSVANSQLPWPLIAVSSLVVALGITQEIAKRMIVIGGFVLILFIGVVLPLLLFAKIWAATDSAAVDVDRAHRAPAAHGFSVRVIGAAALPVASSAARPRISASQGSSTDAATNRSRRRSRATLISARPSSDPATRTKPPPTRTPNDDTRTDSQSAIP